DATNSFVSEVFKMHFSRALQVRHQSAVKSTITVFSSPVSRSSSAIENGCHGSFSPPPVQANEKKPTRPATTAAAPQARSLVPNSAYKGVRPIHQQAAQRPTKKASVGITLSAGIRLIR